MSMHDAFSNLFPSAVTQGVAGVSGVAQAGNINASKALSVTPPRNTSVAKHATGVSTTPDATPEHAHSYDGGVSQKIKETQEDYTLKTPATPETPQKQNTRENFLNHAEKFCSMPCPAMYSAQRWEQIQTDAIQLSHIWGSQVSALGWNPDDVFSLPHGLIHLIEGGEILAVCEKTVVVRASNGKQFNTIRFVALSGETAPKWRIWTAWCEP